MSDPNTPRPRPVWPFPDRQPARRLARTALYNWAFARHHGGTFVFRIEDTDNERNTQESYDALIDLMQLARPRLGRGPAQGGAFGPTASPSAATSTPTCSPGCAASYTYDCYCTTEEVDARRKASGSKVMGYDGFCRELTDEQVAAFEAEGRSPVVRFRMPDGAITCTTWCAATSRSRPSSCPTSRSAAPTATRSTRWSTRSTTR